MDRRVRVTSAAEVIEREPWPGDPGEPLPGTPQTPPSLLNASNPAARHPCLYIGTSGERCSRPAVRGDFCSKHGVPDAEGPSEGALIKRAIAVAGVVAVLWPFIVDLVRALLRLLR
ncbi:MAG TPA: hypothetical protein VLY23_15040 [Candidatus Acidoferrum sp.]|nr:hypothetical protein [Candidatus Acidoferrum sp.]